LATIGLSFLTLPAVAAPTTTVNGQIWFDYSVNTGNNPVNNLPTAAGRGVLPIGYNAFNISRSYLTINTRFDDKLSSQVIFDANSNPSAALKTNVGELVFLKHAYLQNDNPTPFLGNIRVGMVPTFWFIYELGKYWRYPVQSYDIGIKYFGIAPAAFGVSAAGGVDRFRYEAGIFDTPVPLNYTTGVPLTTGLSAGSYKFPTSNSCKNYQARVAMDLPAGMELSGFYSYYRPIGYDRLDSFLALLGHRDENLTLAAEYGQGWISPTGLADIDRKTVSAYGLFGGGLVNKNLSNYELALRLDGVKPDQTADNNGYKEWIAGIGYIPTPGVKIMLADTLRSHDDGSGNENIASLSYGLSY
jgi:hypothetical protein